MNLIIGNKTIPLVVSRLLACKRPLPFEEITVPLDGSWSEEKRIRILAPSRAVPSCDGGPGLWDSLAISDTCADRVGRERFWPKDRRRGPWHGPWSRKCTPAT